MSTLPNDRYCTILEDGMHSDVSTNDRNKLWKCGLVYYLFGKNVSDELKSLVRKAMRMITELSIVKFVERTYQKDYIKITDEGRFASYVGRIGGKQKLHVTKDEIRWPNTVGSVMHELMHALGFHHEHCRPDRNEYVHVGRTSRNYERLKESDVLCYGPYDFESIMHYSENQGVMLMPGINVRIGQRERLSDGDINALNNLYPRSYSSIIRRRRNRRILRQLYDGDINALNNLYPRSYSSIIRRRRNRRIPIKVTNVSLIDNIFSGSLF